MLDLAVLVVEPTGALTKAEMELVEDFRRQRLPAVAVLNKIDLLQNKEEMIPKMQLLSEAYPFEAIVPISALNGDGVEELMKLFLDAAQPGPHFFPNDTLTDQPERVICAEIIREKVLLNMQEEVPHGIAVTIEEMKERENQELVDIRAVIYCERQSHKGMVIGKGGQMLKTIASPSPARYGSLPGNQGQPPVLGQGEGGLAQSGALYPQFRLQLKSEKSPFLSFPMGKRCKQAGSCCFLPVSLCLNGKIFHQKFQRGFWTFLLPALFVKP